MIAWCQAGAISSTVTEASNDVPTVAELVPGPALELGDAGRLGRPGGAYGVGRQRGFVRRSQRPMVAISVRCDAGHTTLT